MLPISSSTSPQELERMLFLVNPECAAMLGDQIDLADEVSRLEDELAETKALVDEDTVELIKKAKQAERSAHASYQKLEEQRAAMRALINAVLTTPRVPKALKAAAKAALYRR